MALAKTNGTVGKLSPKNISLECRRLSGSVERPSLLRRSFKRLDPGRRGAGFEIALVVEAFYRLTLAKAPPMNLLRNHFFTHLLLHRKMGESVSVRESVLSVKIGKDGQR
jgi:hypothetical protein